MLRFLIPAFGDALFNSNEYIKVISITAVLLVFGLINSVSAIVFTEFNSFESSEKISIYPGSANEHDIQSAFTFESGHNTNFSVIFPGAMAGQSQAVSYPPIALAPTSALYLGYGLGLQRVKGKRDYLYSFVHPADTDLIAKIQWHSINSWTALGTQAGHSVMTDYANE